MPLSDELKAKLKNEYEAYIDGIIDQTIKDCSDFSDLYLALTMSIDPTSQCDFNDANANELYLNLRKFVRFGILPNFDDHHDRDYRNKMRLLKPSVVPFSSIAAAQEKEREIKSIIIERIRVIIERIRERAVAEVRAGNHAQVPIFQGGAGAGANPRSSAAGSSP